MGDDIDHPHVEMAVQNKLPKWILSNSMSISLLIQKTKCLIDTVQDTK